MQLKEALERLLEHQDLSSEQMVSVMRHIMSGEASPAQIGAFLMALRMKGESIDEIAAAAQVMRELATPVHVSDKTILWIPAALVVTAPIPSIFPRLPPLWWPLPA